MMLTVKICPKSFSDLFIIDTWIDDGIGNINKEVNNESNQCHKSNTSFNYRIISSNGCGGNKISNAWNSKNIFY